MTLASVEGNMRIKLMDGEMIALSNILKSEHDNFCNLLLDGQPFVQIAASNELITLSKDKILHITFTPEETNEQD